MIFCSHLKITYDNYRCNSCYHSFNYSNFAYFKTQVREKDNRLTTNLNGYLF